MIEQAERYLEDTGFGGKRGDILRAPPKVDLAQLKRYDI
jgi:hypothetical protein